MSLFRAATQARCLVRAARWTRVGAAAYSTGTSETKVYHSKDGTPLVGSEFLRDKRIWILHLLAKETPDTVSYTHLTLPTNREV